MSKNKRDPRPFEAEAETETETERPGAGGPEIEWAGLETDPWHADSTLPASEALTGIPEPAEPELEADPDLEADASSEEVEVDEAGEAPETDESRNSGAPRRRSKTIARKQMLRERRRLIARGMLPEIVEYERPVNRSECRHAERPCLFVSCRYHLYLDVNPNTGSIKINFPDKNVWDLEETCALDVAERGGVTLEEVGDIMNLTRERIRQVEVAGLEKLRASDGDLETFIDGRELRPASRASLPIVDD